MTPNQRGRDSPSTPPLVNGMGAPSKLMVGALAGEVVAVGLGVPVGVAAGPENLSLARKRLNSPFSNFMKTRWDISPQIGLP